MVGTGERDEKKPGTVTCDSVASQVDLQVAILKQHFLQRQGTFVGDLIVYIY